MENIERIEKYIIGAMSDEEKIAFEQEMKNDPILHQEVEEVRDLILGVQVKGFSEDLQNYRIPEEKSGEQPTTKVRRLNIQKWSAIAASLVIILMAGYWLFPKSGTSDLDGVFYTDPGLPTQMSENREYNFYDAMVDYKRGDYAEALRKWDNTNSTIGNDTLSFYKGMAEMYTGSLEKAQSMLEAITSESDLYLKAQWRLVEINIKQKNYDQAKKILQDIPQDFHEDYDKVLDYLNKK